MTLKSFREFLSESSLSRLWRHNLDHDCGGITAFRKAENCGDGERYTHDENEQRNRALRARLQSAGYGVTSLLGRSQEGNTTVTEQSFFVVDLQDGGRLLEDLQGWGQEFEQDSILFIPRGSVDGQAEAFLIGTNDCPNNYLRGGQRETFDAARWGREGKFYTSYVDGRPFFFEEVERGWPLPASSMGRWAMRVIAARPWKRGLR